MSNKVLEGIRTNYGRELLQGMLVIRLSSVVVGMEREQSKPKGGIGKCLLVKEF